MAKRDEVVELPPDYHWRNFRTMMAEVLTHHAHLFQPSERTIIETLLNLDEQAQMLFARLLSRKGDVFRRSKLRYSEVPNLDEAVAALCSHELMAVNPQEVFEEGRALELMTVPQLRRVAKACGADWRGNKSEVLDRLAGVEVAPLLTAEETFLQLSGYEPFVLAQIVFFGNRHQDLSEFVITDLAILSYAAYEVSRDVPLFESRAALNDYVLASQREDEAWQAQAQGDSAALTSLGRLALQDLRSRPKPAAHAAHVDPGRCDERVAFAGARERERQGDLEGAIQDYTALLAVGRSVRRAARVLDRLGLALARVGRAEVMDGFAQPVLASAGLDDPSRHLIERRLARNGLGPDPRKSLHVPDAESMTFEPCGHAGSKALYRGKDGEPSTVEQVVLEAMGGDGFWCEGSLYTTLFGVLFWEEIFSPIDGMFQHRFQDVPLDFDSEHFFANRKAQLERRLASLEDGDLSALAANYGRFEGLRCRGVVWEAYTLDDLVRVAEGLGSALPVIMRRLGRAPHVHRAGLPDLFVFVNDAAMAVEVKGPGDQVSIEQSLWHDVLLRAGVDMRLVRVTRQGG